MNKLVLSLCAAVGMAGVFAGSAARADVGPYDNDDYGYQPRYRPREYRGERGYRESREDGYERCRPGQVYVIERGCPVRRVVYFDQAGRCFYPAGPRRVYVQNYYHEYPRFHRRRPPVSLSFSFGG